MFPGGCPHIPTSLFVVPEERPQRVPVVAVPVDVDHAAPQAGLQLLRVVAEEQHDRGPAERRERGPGVVVDARVQGLRGHEGEADAGLDGEAREGQDDPGEDVDDDLLVDRRDLARSLGAPAEDEVAADQTGEEGVIGPYSKSKLVRLSYLWPRPQ